MRYVISFAFAAASLVTGAPVVSAHHSFAAEFDEKNCGEFTGTLTAVDWQNPHAYFFIDSKNAKGEPAKLTFQTSSLANMIRGGTPRGYFVQNVGKTITVRGKIATTKKPHPEYPDPLFNGNSSAWWEGDTLIIDSISFDERTWISGNGWYHSDQLHVIERIRRPSLNYLEYQFTVEDPKVLTKSWTSGWRKFSLSQEDDHLLENYCTNEQNSEQFRKLADQEKAAQGK